MVVKLQPFWAGTITLSSVCAPGNHLLPSVIAWPHTKVRRLPTGFTLVHAERYCAGFCVTVGDCPAAVPSCIDVEVNVPSGVTTQAQFICAR